MDWLNFAVVVCVQLGTLSLVVREQGDARAWKGRQLTTALAVGLIFGIAFDLVFGKLFGVFSYALGFTPLFLVMNGIFSYGVFFVTVRALHRASRTAFYAWSVGMAFLYELTNAAFPVWSWQFASSALRKELVAIFVLYGALMVPAALVLEAVTGVRFRIFRR